MPIPNDVVDGAPILPEHENTVLDHLRNESVRVRTSAWRSSDTLLTGRSIEMFDEDLSLSAARNVVGVTIEVQFTATTGAFPINMIVNLGPTSERMRVSSSVNGPRIVGWHPLDDGSFQYLIEGPSSQPATVEIRRPDGQWQTGIARSSFRWRPVFMYGIPQTL